MIVRIRSESTVTYWVERQQICAQPVNRVLFGIVGIGGTGMDRCVR